MGRLWTHVWEKVVGWLTKFPLCVWLEWADYLVAALEADGQNLAMIRVIYLVIKGNAFFFMLGLISEDHRNESIRIDGIN
jgi:hypothetical protein